MKAAAALVALVALVAAALLAARAWDAAPAPGRQLADSRAAPVNAGAAARPAVVAAAAVGVGVAAAAVPAVAAPDLSLTDQQELIPDFALRQLMDSFLLNRSEAGRLQALEAHLRRVLPASAADDAIQIAVRYQAYLTAHDELLAAQHFTSSDAASQDLNRIGSWREQRQQLRVRTLGERITLEWFGSEDAYLEQALIEWRQRSEGQASTVDAAPEDQAAHELHMRQALSQAIASYQRAASAN